MARIWSSCEVSRSGTALHSGQVGAAHEQQRRRRVAEVVEADLGRVGQPEDVAGAVASLLSADTRWITGQRVEVNGGYRL